MSVILQISKARTRWTGLLAVTTVLLSAFLLFVLELAVAKALLPRFGGSPMVWTTSMLVYQVLLFAGYAYAHGVASCRSVKHQALIHAFLLAGAVAVAWWRLKSGVFTSGDPAAVSRQPFLDLLITLLGTLGLPFIAVSATSPLVQHWHQRMGGGHGVYRLYAVSNIGSFAALLAYPFVVEPLLSVDSQLVIWSALFSLAAVGIVALGVRQSQAGVMAHREEESSIDRDEATTRGGWREIVLWLALPAATSALLLSSTNELCQDLAVFPFLWILPLALYLLSFTLAFRAREMKNKMAASAVVTVVALSTTAASVMIPAPVHVVALSALVFTLCLAVHRELYRLRPPVRRLTAYYLWISLGSGIGATAVAIGAPMLFSGYWEFPLTILILWILLAVTVFMDQGGALRNGDSRQSATLLVLVLYLLLNQVPGEWLVAHFSWWLGEWSLFIRLGVVLLLSSGLWFGVLRRRPLVNSALWPRILAGLMIFMAEVAVVQRTRGDLSGSGGARNFFGVVRVQEVLHTGSGIQIRQLTHGRINHGWQYVNPELRSLPTSYHSPSTGIGRLIRVLQQRKPSVSIGVTGLGAGALAAYPRRSDAIVFYEIDPEVVRLAEGMQAVFSFLNDSPGRCEVVLGDARQSMQRELLESGSRKYDVLALDAFSSDAIPMHLLTKEAFVLYFEHLAEDGVVAVNISNRFLDIEPVLKGVADEFGLHALFIDSLGDRPVNARSLWVLLSKNVSVLQDKEIAGVSRPLKGEIVSWTDNSCSPFKLMRWWNINARALRLNWKRSRQSEDSTAAELSPSRKL